MFRKIFSLSSSLAVLRARVSWSLSISLSTDWMPLSSTWLMSSKTNISRRISSTSSGLSSSNPSMIDFSVVRSVRLSISATEGTPPIFSKLWVSIEERRSSSPSSTSRTISGLVLVMPATRLTTSTCLGPGSPPRISLALA